MGSWYKGEDMDRWKVGGWVDGLIDGNFISKILWRNLLCLFSFSDINRMLEATLLSLYVSFPGCNG